MSVCEIFKNTIFIEHLRLITSDSLGHYLKIYLDIILKTTKWGSIGEFNAIISAVEFHYIEIIVFGIHTNFTYDSEPHDIGKLYSDSLKFYYFLIRVCTQFNLYIAVINLVNPFMTESVII